MNVTALLLLLLGFFYFTSAGLAFFAFLCLIALILVVLSSAFGGTGKPATARKGGSNTAIEGMGSAFGKIVNWFGKTLGALFLGGGKKEKKKDKPQVLEIVHRKR